MKKLRIKQSWKRYAIFALAALVCVIILWKLIPGVTSVVDGIWGFLGLLWKALTPVGWAVVVAYLLSPLASFLERRVFYNLNVKNQRIFATLTVTLLIAVGIFFFSYRIVPMFVVSAAEAVERLPDIIEPWIESSRYGSFVGELWRQGQKLLGESVNVSAKTLLVTAGQVAQALMTTVIAIYILHRRGKLLSALRNAAEQWLGEERRKNIAALLNMLHRVFGGYLIGKLLESAAITLLCAAGFYVIGVAYAPLLAVFVGICSFVPYVGPLIGAAPAVLVTFLEMPDKLLPVAIVLIIVFAADGCWIGPKLIGGRLGISALGVIIGVTVGGGIAGLWGMVLGIPAVAIVNMAARALTEWKSEKRASALQDEPGEGQRINDDIHD